MNISIISKNKLCLGCGTCVSICPVDAIHMEICRSDGMYHPIVNDDMCTQCGLCVNTCPGRGFIYPINNDSLHELFIGKAREYYIGYSNNKDIRFHSSSGGLVTQLLLYLLENKLVDAVITTSNADMNPLRPTAKIVTCRQKVLESSQSKYAPVPVNAKLKEALSMYDRIAVVGLPCHMQGIMLLSSLNDEYRSKIKYRLSLFCNHPPNLYAYSSYLNHQNISVKDVNALYYRGFGWPGEMRIITNHEKKLKHNWAFVGNFVFHPWRCLFCPDMFGEVADLSFGDPWLPEVSDERIGLSLIISRSEKGNAVLQNMSRDGGITINQISYREVIRSQSTMLYVKKILIYSKRIFTRYFPYYNNYKKSQLPEYLLSFPPIFTVILSQSFLSKIMRFYIPPNLLKFFHYAYYFIVRIRATKYIRISMN